VVTIDLEGQEVKRNVGERVKLRRYDVGRQEMMTTDREEVRERKIMYGGLLK